MLFGNPSFNCEKETLGNLKKNIFKGKILQVKGTKRVFVEKKSCLQLVFSSYPVDTLSLITSILKEPLPHYHSIDHDFLNIYLSPLYLIPCCLIPAFTEKPAYDQKVVISRRTYKHNKSYILTNSAFGLLHRS